MNRKPIYAGLLFDPDSEQYRNAVKTHQGLGGKVENCEFKKFDMWIQAPAHWAWTSFHYRPVGPLRTSAYPEGAPECPEGFRYLYTNEQIFGGDYEWSLVRKRWEEVEGGGTVGGVGHFISTVYGETLINTKQYPLLQDINTDTDREVMIDDEEIKLQINNLIWMYGRSDLTLKEAEKAAVNLLNAIT